MNSQQRQELLDKIHSIASEHCQAFVFIAQVERDDAVRHEDDTMLISNWLGGLTFANGLVERFKKYLNIEEQKIFGQNV